MSWRLGTTSFIIPDDILPNVRFLAGKVADIELLFFEIAPDGKDLPSAETLSELHRIAQSSHLTYTVHLPLQLQLSDISDQNETLKNSRQLIRLAKSLNPWAYVLHLHEDQTLSSAETRKVWQHNTLENLKILAEIAGDPKLVVIENLEHYPPDFVEAIVEKSGVARCFDVGHLWLEGHDPIPHLIRALPNTRVIHLHGISTRDHKSLCHVLPEKLDVVLLELHKAQYNGVLTIEVFNEPDLTSSLQTLDHAMERLNIKCLN